jgi:zinc D-Ala-D-Ala dipeptidase
MYAFIRTSSLLITLLVSVNAVSQEIPENKYGLKVIDTFELYEETVEIDENKRLVNLEEFIPGIVLDIRYATNDNFTGSVLYDTSAAFLRYPAAWALRKIQERLSMHNLGLKIWDAYRPYSVTEHLWEYVQDPRYAADPRNGSRHNRGCAVDLTLIYLDSGDEVSMPTVYDDFTEKAHIDFTDLPAEILEHRELLREVMERFGFTVLPSEWWHFDFNGWEGYELMDIPFKQLLNNYDRKHDSTP